ncbi:9665_t:CDS:2 [Ambispora leptoticha]|uniref:9665_t:CDS:1 n=1 Tax=Ambispora leptoticha TaxID=144679 RepID=A0A9N8VAR9_9GLOM|nr:9665_t:CDS:2 [Ambispora leptoticha]
MAQIWFETSSDLILILFMIKERLEFNVREQKVFFVNLTLKSAQLSALFVEQSKITNSYLAIIVANPPQ